MTELKRILRGYAHTFGDDINTDYIISSKYKSKIMDMAELSKYIMEDIAPGFTQQVKPGDFVVAGHNFGSGSSREAAAVVLREAGIGAVLAKSFARIFFRNAMNVGLAAIECDTSNIETGDELEVDLTAGQVRNLTRNQNLTITPLPPVMLAILQEGGLVEHFRRHGGFALDIET